MTPNEKSLSIPDRKEKQTWLLQQDFIDSVTKSFGIDGWVTVYSGHESEVESVGFFCALIPNANVDAVLQKTSWDLSIGAGRPGCTVYGADENARYLRFGNDEGIEPLVIKRNFHGIRPSVIEIAEEFRYFHNLYPDARNNTHVKIDDEGNEENVAIVEGEVVRIRLKELKQFLAIKEMHLAIYFDSVRFTTDPLTTLGVDPISKTNTGDKLIYLYYIGDYHGPNRSDYKSFSHVRGKKLIQGTTKDKSGFWPFDDPKKKFEDYIIGVDSNGDPIQYTCDPDKLADYFGANRGAPHYLTPVFFRRDVLNKYYAVPGKYSVEDGYLRCGSLWGLRLDNNHERYVLVFLGDLGQDLSHNEQLYWKTYNVPPDGTISQVNFKRSFGAEFADPEASDLLFKCRFETFHENWAKANGWPLFKPLSSQDHHYYVSLRIPLADDQAEFDNQVSALAKILVESINEEEINKRLTTRGEGIKGITKLEEYLRERGLTDYSVHINFLRNLHDLRHGSAHRKGKIYEKAACSFQLSGRDLRIVFRDILKGAICLLEHLMTSVGIENDDR